ncbi:uncharacterized protein Z520_00576 [Fonsecaea multimorphosa CBS 102226]|uniref:Uncharacterized protein n=1 Tax=Fonsecaea multimorphosa CBS 102226 TaxID=1442371 RepID=A0A0D2KKB2_9EURO|nr:uncharacterized protein Z520_00576 [Fonsecaea multimorphosa CBS 102226]KIY03885.1 hypothetical protein Z520_00576 [Fonsecaea multimorphosa CBS 102226]OAL32146.1 hypothetical protein AYO22_00595 [Fonsecaea multimorphosa]
MFEHGESQGKYAVVSEAAWSPPPKKQAKPVKYWAPFSTRWPALTLFLLAMLACIAALEYGIRSGLTLEEKNQQQNHSRLKRQDADVSSLPAAVTTTSAMTETPSTAPSVISTTTTAESTTPLTGSASIGAYIDQSTTSSSDRSSTTVSSTMLPVSSSTTAYVKPITSLSTTTGGETETMTIASDTTPYIQQSVTTPEVSETPLMASGTTPYIVPSTSTPGISATPVMKSSTTPYIAQESSSTAPQDAETETTTGYVQQSTTSVTSPVPKQSSSTRHTNPYTVPSNSASSFTHTTTPMALTGLGTIRTTELSSAPLTGSFEISGSSAGQIHSEASSILGGTLTSSLSASVYSTNSEAESSPSKTVYGEGHTTSAPSSSAKSSNQQFTALVTYTTEDASGKPLTTVATETYAVAVMTETVYDSSGKASTLIATLTSYSGTITPTILAESTSVPTDPPDHQRADEVELGLAVSDLQYFRAIYLPVLIAVILKLVWAVVFTSTKMMEPFYLLSREKGASAKESLLADYLTTSVSIEDAKKIFLSHPVVTLVSLVYLCLSALPAIATQSTTVRAIAWCRSPTLIMERCNPMWYLKVDYARALQAVLSLIAVIILLVVILSIRRRSGVFSNPSSIATMASLLSSEEFMEDLRRIDQRSSRSSARQLLDPYRYMLRQHQTTTGYTRYGIVKESGQPEEVTINYTKQPKYSAVTHSHAGGKDVHHSRSTLSNRFLIDTLFLLCILALLGVLVGYYMDGQDDPFNNYFNHNPTSSFVLTAAASLLDIRWKQLEREVRLMTPYRRLFRGSAKPESTILVSQNSTPLTSIFQALWRGNFFHAFVAFVAILSDVLIIAIGGVPFNSAQIWLDFLVSIYTSWAILALMVLTVFAIFRWRALNEKMMLPREPTRLLTVWLMLCNEDNQLRDEMQGHETMNQKERDDRVKMRGGLYWAGWLSQPDGSRRWCLEKESGQASGMNMMYEHN